MVQDGSLSVDSESLRVRVLPRVRHSQDAGIRLAGGPIGEVGAEMWGQGEHDGTDEVVTLPPSYAQIHGGGPGS